MTIVPAVMAMLGGRAWWIPKWLDRIIPNVDLEGAGLERRPEPESAPAPRPTAEPAGAET
jgi:RND superfamily putative drug exporter